MNLVVYPLDILQKYKSRGVLLDTNLLLVLAVGNYRKERILSFKRTLQYTIEDYTLLTRIAAYFDRRVTTPNILTEVDNLARQLPSIEYKAISAALAELISGLLEIYVPSLDASKTKTHEIFGLTDCVTVMSAADVLLVTDDLRLASFVSQRGRDAININHIRTMNWKR
jgi:hypothetical protein